MYNDGYLCSYINVARSAIASTFAFEGNSLGEHPLVRRFMLGVRNLLKPVPKYPVFRDAKGLLLHLQGWKVHSQDLKSMSLKLATILACLSLQRIHSITHIDANVQFLDSATYLFVFHDLKVARQRPYFVISLPALSDSDPLGAAPLLRDYIMATNAIRSSNQLLVSYVAPHQPVSVDTVARWVRSVMKDAGIDTSKFGSHSIRGAPASADKDMLAPLEAVLRAGDWSTLSSFNKHHRQSSQLLSSAVASALLSSLPSVSSID